MTENTYSRRRVLQGVAGTALTTSLAGCSSEIDGPRAIFDDGDEQSLRYAQVLPPVKLDPVVCDEPWSGSVVSQVFEGLYEYDHRLDLRPVLAEGLPTVENDGRTYEVAVRPEATFQNGVPVTAEDVRYSYEAPFEERGAEAANRWSANPIETIRTPDDHTVVFELGEPYPAFHHSLTRGVVSANARKPNPKEFAREEPFGSGPYEVETFEPEKYAVLTRWNDYWGDTTAAVDRVRFVPNHSGLARTTSLKTSQNDVVERIEPKLWESTKTMPNARVASAPSFQYVYVGFNTNDGPMAKPSVRRAVDAVFDMESVAKHFVGPTGSRTYAPLPSRMAEAWGFPVEDWREIPLSKDLKSAKATFAREVKRSEDVQSGWHPTVAVPKHDLLREKVGEKIVHGLKEAGFQRARTKTYPFSTFRERVLSGSSSDYDLFVGSWTGGPDPDTFLYPLFHRQMAGVTNGTFFSDPNVMDALELARQTRDSAERKRLYEHVIGTVLEQRVHLPAFVLDSTFGVTSHVAGFEPHPLSAENPRLAGDPPLRLQ